MAMPKGENGKETEKKESTYVLLASFYFPYHEVPRVITVPRKNYYRKYVQYSQAASFGARQIMPRYLDFARNFRHDYSLYCYNA